MTLRTVSSGDEHGVMRSRNSSLESILAKDQQADVRVEGYLIYVRADVELANRSGDVSSVRCEC